MRWYKYYVKQPNLGGFPCGPVVRPNGGDALVQHAVFQRQIHATLIVYVNLSELGLISIFFHELLPHRGHLLAGAASWAHILDEPEVGILEDDGLEVRLRDGGTARAVRAADGREESDESQQKKARQHLRVQRCDVTREKLRREKKYTNVLARTTSMMTVRIRIRTRTVIRL